MTRPKHRWFDGAGRIHERYFMRYSLFFLLLLVVASPPGFCVAEGLPNDVAQQIADLRSDDYFTRERATEALTEAGVEAIAPLVEAIAAGELETTARAITILGRLANAADAETSAAAEKALDTLSLSSEPLVAGRAKTALRERQEVRRDKAAAKLQELGANLQFQEGKLQTVIMQGPAWRGTADDWQLLRWFPEMTSLICRDMTLDDGAWRFFSPDLKLQYISLNEVRVTDVGLGHLERLPAVRVLQVVNGGIGDASMRVIGQLPTLDILYLVGGDITDAGIQQLAGLKSLRNLRLERLPLTDASLETILQLPNLEWLDLNRLPELKGEPLKNLGALTRLQYLFVKYCPVGEATLEGMQKSASLMDARLYGTNISIEAADKYAAAHPGVRFDHRAGGLLGVYGTPNIQGCLLQEVRQGMGAAKAGIEVNDSITHFNGAPINDFDSLRAMIRSKPPGEVVEIRGKRKGEDFTKLVTLSEDQE